MIYSEWTKHSKWWDVTSEIKLQKTEISLVRLQVSLSGSSCLPAVMERTAVRRTEDGLWPSASKEPRPKSNSPWRTELCWQPLSESGGRCCCSWPWDYWGPSPCLHCSIVRPSSETPAKSCPHSWPMEMMISSVYCLKLLFCSSL